MTSIIEVIDSLATFPLSVIGLDLIKHSGRNTNAVGENLNKRKYSKKITYRWKGVAFEVKRKNNKRNESCKNSTRVKNFLASIFIVFYTPNGIRDY